MSRPSVYTTVMSILTVSLYLTAISQDKCPFCAAERTSFDLSLCGDLGQSLYTFSVVVWLCSVDLTPQGLKIWGNLRRIYDVFAIAIVTTLFVRLTWPEVMAISEVISSTFWGMMHFLEIYSFDSLKENCLLSVSDGIALALFIWVSCSVVRKGLLWRSTDT